VSEEKLALNMEFMNVVVPTAVSLASNMAIGFAKFNYVQIYFAFFFFLRYSQKLTTAPIQRMMKL